ncbi:MAG: ergothioneine biosynthesis protein EgtB [Gemmataceae bacterium]|nr:ergothioneine biosynthesis protein EgtB [Gemmataceae bacterium]
MAAHQLPSPEILSTWVRDARQRTLALMADLSDEQLLGPRLAIVNPMLWEVGHLAWFQEHWVLRHVAGQAPLRADADALYDSSAVPHATRWDLSLPSRADTLTYMQQVHDRILQRLQREPSAAELYFVMLSVFHEDMHDEAFLYTRQTLGYSAPHAPLPGASWPPSAARGSGALEGDVVIPGGTFMLGAPPDEPFVFDNEKWAHPVQVQPFAMARAAVTQGEFLTFVDRGGYYRPESWSTEGWQWRQAVDARHPVYWRRTTGAVWQRREFDCWVNLEPHLPVLHINWFEADAYCRWINRRLPTELEWEVAAAAQRGTDGNLASGKRRFPWGDEPPDASRANLDGCTVGPLDVAALPAGDSAFGCRQMIGNVWEWTASDFKPYPGFVVDPYKEYSQPWFGTHKVLRGGCWATRPRLLRNTWRNFYTPDRRDVWAGFRTCALGP